MNNACVKKLTAASMPEAQAEVIVHESMAHGDTLLTKQDCDASNQLSRKEFITEMRVLRKDMFIRFGAMLVAAQLVTIGIILTLAPMVLAQAAQ